MYQKVVFHIQCEGHHAEFVTEKWEESVLDVVYHRGLCFVIEFQGIVSQQMGNKKDNL